MKVTEVRFTASKGKSKVVAFASITIDDALVVRDGRVIQGEKGLFYSFPSKKVNEKYYDIVFSLSRELRDSIGGAVIAEFKKQGGLHASEDGEARETEAGPDVPF